MTLMANVCNMEMSLSTRRSLKTAAGKCDSCQLLMCGSTSVAQYKETRRPSYRHRISTFYHRLPTLSSCILGNTNYINEYTKFRRLIY